MKHKQMVISLIVAISILGGAGCQKKEEVSREGYTWEHTEIPQTVKEKITEDIMIDAKVKILPGFEDGEADILNVRESAMDREKILSVLSQGEKEVKERAEEYETETVYYYDFSNNATLTIARYWANYRSELSGYLANCMRFGNGQDGNNVEIFENNQKDLPFMKREEAQEKCYQILEDLKIGADANPLRSFSMEHTLLEEQEVVLEMEDSNEPGAVPKASWTEEDDCYYFEFLPTVSQCGIVVEAYVDSNRIYPTLPYQVIYGKNGVVQFASNGQFSTEDIEEKDKALINYQTTLQKIKKYYENILADKKITIKEMTLGYILLFTEEENQYQAEPAWVFTVEEEDKSTGHLSYDKVVIDAVTGEEIS